MSENRKEDIETTKTEGNTKQNNRFYSTPTIKHDNMTRKGNEFEI